ncbi:MAG: hypothetical protein GTO14_11545 [Anaerolineales bacterium]|nr:hypothetical protein [Anaerolineales bacterium]
MDTSSGDLVIANRLTDARHWKGIIDEVRISNIARSTCWIQTEFNNQKYPNKAQYPTNGFITVNPEVSLNSAPSAPTTPYSDNIRDDHGRHHRGQPLARHHLRRLRPSGCHHLSLAHHLLGR